MKNIIIIGKDIDRNFCYEIIINIMKKNFGLDNINGINFCTSQYFKDKAIFANAGNLDKVIAVYNPTDKKIYINEQAFNAQCRSIVEKCSPKFSKEEKKLLKLFFASQLLLHETLHPSQYKILERDKESVKKLNRTGKIINLTDLLSVENYMHLFFKSAPTFQSNSLNDSTDEYIANAIKDYQNFLLSNYGCDIIKERDAQIQSYRFLKIICLRYMERFPNLFKYIDDNLLASQLMGYKIEGNKVISPVQNILSFLVSKDYIDTNNYTRDIERLNKMDKYMNLSPNNTSIFRQSKKRLVDGFPITYKEYTNFNERIIKAIKDKYIVKSYGETVYSAPKTSQR